ncbi:unnamed protein product [Meloidogyne enterolobii]|uniref:Uncharacterized protein n=1 Tax=Meloidogyne enterolobii TaxID=390850 RepID=A0ACB1A0W7_MELEN
MNQFHFPNILYQKKTYGTLNLDKSQKFLDTWEPRSSIKHLEVFKVFEKEHKKQRSSTKKVKNGKEEKGGADQIKKWEKFFEACCDLPTKLRKKYASTFVKQRIQPNLLRDLG